MANISIYEGKDIGLTAEGMAMLQALYSRSPASVEVQLKKVQKNGPENFMQQFYCGYSHKSIGDCGTISIFIEGISHIACKAIQSNTVSSYQESSTRYLDFSKQPLINPFDLSIYRNRVMVHPTLIEEVEHILKMWVSLYSKYLPFVKEAILNALPRKEGQEEKIYERAANAKAFDIMRAFLPLGSATNTSWTTNLRQAKDHLTMVLFHPQMEVRDIAETIWKQLQKKYPSSFENLDEVLLDLKNVYLDNGGLMNNYYMDSPALCNINPHSTTESVLNIDHPKRFQMSQEKAGYLRYNLRTFDMVGMYEALAHLEAFWLLEERPKNIEVPKWFAKFGTIGIDYVLDFGSFRDIQRHRAGSCPIPLINFKDVTIHPWYLGQLKLLLETVHTDSGFNSVYHEFENDLNCQFEKLIELTEHTPIQNGLRWLLGSQYLMPLGAMCLCTGSYSLSAMSYWAELRSSSTVHPTLRPIAINTCEFLAQTFNTFTIYPDLREEELVYHRGKQTIEEKQVA